MSPGDIVFIGFQTFVKFFCFLQIPWQAKVEPLQISTVSEATKESKQPKEKKAKGAAASEKPPVVEEAPATTPPPPPPQTIEGEWIKEMLSGHPCMWCSYMKCLSVDGSRDLIGIGLKYVRKDILSIF